MNYCLYCGKEISNTKKFCDHSCQNEYYYEQKIQEWKNGDFNGLKGESQLSGYIRKYMLRKTNFACELCGWNKINPFTGTLPLEIHHKDGDYKNNQEENLQVLCPNCHSLTEHHKGANRGFGREDRLEYVPRKKNFCIDCGKEISNGSLRCVTCAGKARIEELPISREELKQKIRTQTFVSIGKEFGISDNAIKKWCDKYNLPRKKIDINKFTDEEWEKI